MAIKRLFNDGWEFVRLQIGTPLESLKAPDLNWEKIDLPHDWLIYDTAKLYEDGEGWYRRRFTAPELAPGGRLALRFDGVYMDSTVFVNGQSAGDWKYGYSAFEFDISQFIQPGYNELLVRVVFQAPNSRWYSGAGIYRDVWLISRPVDHISADGVYVSTVFNGQIWQILVDTELVLGSCPAGLVVRQDLLDAAGQLVVSSDQALTDQAANGRLVVNQAFTVTAPVIWDIRNPALYSLQTKLIRDGQVIDEESCRIGFRTIGFDPDRGFFLNGRQLKLNGVCQHHDLGCLGAAFNRAAARRQFRILKSMGVNAVRTAHNMPAEALMELADEMGLLIISEAFDMWESPKTPYDYARFFQAWVERDVASWIRRDRNHPSLIMWSIGNEISDTHHSERGQVLTRYLMELVKQQDPRTNAPVTIGSNYMPWENAQKCADIVKLAGYNYAEKYYDAHHAAHPDWIIYGSETSSIVQSRGIYHFPAAQSLLADDDEQCSSLGNSATSWGAKSLESCITGDRDKPFSLGQFLWSGFDYIGEPTPYHTKNSYFGQIDTCGFPKDAYYIYQAAWTDWREQPMVHLFPYWDFNDGQMIDIRVCSNAPKVELFFNDQSQGCVEIDQKGGQKLIGEWQLAYKPGELRAVAYDDQDAVIAVAHRRSFGEAVKLVAQPDKLSLKADGQDLIFVEISAVDADGRPVDNANNRVELKLTGAGRLIGLDNGDSTDYDQWKGTSRRLFSGKLLAVIAAKLQPGKLELQLSSPGLPTETLVLKALACQRPEGVSALMSNPPSQVIHEIPVRKIELTSPDGQVFSPGRTCFKVKAKLLPENTSYREVEWRVVNDAGIDTNIAKLTSHGLEATVTALGDGAFRLRCLTRNGAAAIRLISQLEFQVQGLGRAYLNPYEFIAGALYNVSRGELGNGNERGVATARDGESQVGFRDLDFGPFGSDTLTIPIFSLDSQEFPIEIWEGLPDEPGSQRLALVTYQKPSIWNTYQAATYVLERRLRGITTLCFVLHRKIHIKGFSFMKPNKAFSQLAAAHCDRLYGDSYKLVGEAVEAIGNNVTLEFDDMDFGDAGCSGIIINGRSPIPANTIHIRFEAAADSQMRIVEFGFSDNYCEQEFQLEPVKGCWKLSFVFLPGSRFDFKWFRFI